MTHTSKWTGKWMGRLAFLAFLFCLGINPALAEDIPPQSAVSADDEIVMVDEGTTQLALNEMDDHRGAAGTSLLSAQTLAATTTGNVFAVAGDLTTGSISLGDSLSGLGFGSYVMNTGNNTAINSAVSLSVQILPAP